RPGTAGCRSCCLPVIEDKLSAISGRLAWFSPGSFIATLPPVPGAADSPSNFPGDEHERDRAIPTPAERHPRRGAHDLRRLRGRPGHAVGVAADPGPRRGDPGAPAPLR